MENKEQKNNKHKLPFHKVKLVRQSLSTEEFSELTVILNDQANAKKKGKYEANRKRAKENAEFRRQIKELKEKMEEMKQEMEEKVEEMKQENVELKEEIQMLEEENQTLKEDKRELEERLETLGNASFRLNRAFANTQQQLQETKEQLAEKKEQLEEKNERIQRCSAEKLEWMEDMGSLIWMTGSAEKWMELRDKCSAKWFNGGRWFGRVCEREPNVEVIEGETDSDDEDDDILQELSPGTRPTDTPR